MSCACSSPASAQSVALDMTACPAPTSNDVRAVLAVELPEQLLREGEPIGPDAHVIEVHCAGDAAELTLRGSPAHRTLSLSSVPPELRARVVALSVAELARPQPPAAQPTAEREPEPEREPERERESEPDAPLVLWAGVEAQATPLLGLGGALEFRAKILDYLSWSSALDLARSTTHIDRGELRTLSLSLRTGLALLLETAHASLHAGAGIRGTWHHLRGVPTDPEATAAAGFDAWSLGPAAFIGTTLRLAPWLFVALELEVALALREIRANVEAGNTRTLSPVRSSAVLGAGVSW